jgi:Ion channel
MLLTFAFVFNTILVALAILIHYEVLFQLDKKLPKIAHLPSRFRVLIGVAVIFFTHVIEIWLFALGYFVTLQFPGMGQLVGVTAGHGVFLDYVYLSFITFTTVGYGDFVAQGYVRYLTGVEALVGLLLITWSASFLFLEMQKYWTDSKSR